MPQSNLTPPTDEQLLGIATALVAQPEPEDDEPIWPASLNYPLVPDELWVEFVEDRTLPDTQMHLSFVLAAPESGWQAIREAKGSNAANWEVAACASMVQLRQLISAVETIEARRASEILGYHEFTLRSLLPQARHVLWVQDEHGTSPLILRASSSAEALAAGAVLNNGHPVVLAGKLADLQGLVKRMKEIVDSQNFSAIEYDYRQGEHALGNRGLAIRRAPWLWDHTKAQFAEYVAEYGINEHSGPGPLNP